jgi:hypothetical protein
MGGALCTQDAYNPSSTKCDQSACQPFARVSKKQKNILPELIYFFSLIMSKKPMQVMNIQCYDGFKIQHFMSVSMPLMRIFYYI